MNVSETVLDLTAPRMWNARGLLNNNGWRIRVPDDVYSEFAGAIPYLPESPDHMELWPESFPALSSLADEIKNILFREHGVCLVKGLAGTFFTTEQHRLFYAMLGVAIGIPQKSYDLLLVPTTNGETEFHTDGSSIDAMPEILGLLCETPSLNGGEFQIANGLLIYHLLKRHAPKTLNILKRSFIRDIVTPGQEVTPENLKKNAFPICSADRSDRSVVFSYRRSWIERGHQRAEQPLSREEIEALDTLDSYLNNPRYRAGFRMEKGDMVYFNNMMIAHSQTAYQGTPENVPLLWRMWMASDQHRTSSTAIGQGSLWDYLRGR